MYLKYPNSVTPVGLLYYEYHVLVWATSSSALFVKVIMHAAGVL
jgi:hypothetical protein